MPIEEHAQSEVESEFEERKMKELGINVSSKYCIISYESGVKMKERDTPFCTVRTARSFTTTGAIHDIMT